MSMGEPGTNNTAHQRDWDTQRERLSAYLDDQLAPAERAALERHLPACARCAAELAELRRIVALLHAMPAPALPRSFALPATAAQAEDARDREQPAYDVDREQPVALAPSSVRRPFRAAPGATTGAAPAITPIPRRPAPWVGIAQWAGGLAAVAGLLVLLSGALAGLPSALHMGGESTSAGAAVNYPAMHTPDHALATTPPASGTADNQSRTPLPATPTSSGTYAPIATPPFAQHTTGTNGPALPVLPLTGGGLLLGGGLVFIAARATRRRT